MEAEKSDTLLPLPCFNRPHIFILSFSAFISPASLLFSPLLFLLGINFVYTSIAYLLAEIWTALRDVFFLRTAARLL